MRVEGEVKRPGIYPVEPGESLLNVLEKAGGITQDGYLYGAEFYRASVKSSQRKNLDKVIRELQEKIDADTSQLAQNVNMSTPEQARQYTIEATQRKKALERLKQVDVNGRLTLGIKSDTDEIAHLPSLRLEPGDKLVVPSRPDFVQVLGKVGVEAALIWRPGRTVADYLNEAGVDRDGDISAAFILHANGLADSNATRYITSIKGVEVMPGDVIVVPEKSDKETAWTAFTRNAKDFTQIFYQLGLGAAAIKTLRQ